MPLAPLAPVDQKPQGGEAGAEAPTSFRDRKLHALQGEAEPTPGKPPEPSAESDEDGYPDEPTAGVVAEFEDDEDTAGEEDEVPRGESDDELDPGGEDDSVEGDEDEPTVKGLQQDLLTAQQALSRATANRKQIEEDFSTGIAENISMRHQLEDTMQSSTAQGEFWLGMANQQVSKFENLDWSQIPPEKMAAVRLQAQQAMANRGQIVQHFKNLAEKNSKDRELIKGREAEIAKNVLSRRIPGWGDALYGKLRDHSVQLGYSSDEFNDLTDWRVMELIHRDYERGEAISKVQSVKRKQKAQVPRNRNGRLPPRSAKGRYRGAREDAFANPGDKGSFREMKFRQMQGERKRGEGR